MSGLVEQWLSVGTTFGELRIYTARIPSTTRRPAVLILHSVMGLDDYIKSITKQFANEGYWAAAPDLYFNDDTYQEQDLENIEIAAHMSRDATQRELALSRYAEEQRASILKACDWIARRRTETYADMVRDVFRAVRSYPQVRSVGAMGFCMGGRLVGELAENTSELAAGVMHYGRPPKVESVQKIACPLQGHYASRDTNITERVPPFAAAMSKAGKRFDCHVYEAEHGFSLAPHLPAHDPESARVSLELSRQFLRECLRPQLSPASSQTECV